MTPEERFWAKVEKTETCWIWVGGKTGRGYGAIQIKGRSTPAHRFSYELLAGPIPEGLEIDHLCRNKSCVNPAHLEPVTPRENQWRGIGTFADVHGKKTHCKNGHPFDDQNTYRFSDKRRVCRVCKSAAYKRWEPKRKPRRKVDA